MYDMPMHEGRELPRFTLRENDLPEIKGWKVNGEYYIVMKVKMTGNRVRSEMDDKNDSAKMEADFEMRTIRALGDKPVDAKTLEQKEFQRVTNKILAGEYV